MCSSQKVDTFWTQHMLPNQSWDFPTLLILPKYSYSWDSKQRGGTELPYICDKYSFCSLIGFLYGTTQGINYSQMLIYTLRVFLHSLHSRSWGKVVQEHTNLMCSIVPGTDRIFPWSFFTTLGALGEDSLWGLCPLRKIPNIFPFHFSSQEA